MPSAHSDLYDEGVLDPGYGLLRLDCSPAEQAARRVSPGRRGGG